VPSSVEQNPDGVLQRYQSMVKFGIAGYDPWTGHGDIRSYGPRGDSSVSYANYGIQGESSDRSPLRVPEPSDNPSVFMLRNQEISDTIRWFVNNGNTPTAAALADYNYMFAHHSKLTPPEDPYAACRPTAVIVITDGEPNAGENSSFYHSSEWQTGALLADHDVRSYIVGFAAGSGPANKLRNMAANGGTCPPLSAQCSLTCPAGQRCYNGACTALADIENCYYAADSENGLRLAMSTVISDILNGKASRTKPATSSRVSFRKDQVGMYEVLASFEIESGNPRWKGHLERVTYQCVSGELQPVDVINMGDQLALQAACEETGSDCGQSRNILTRDSTGTKLVNIADPDAGGVDPGEENPFSDACEVVDPNKNEAFSIAQHASGYWYMTLNTQSSYFIHPYKCVTDFDCKNHGEVCMHGKCGKPKNKCNTTPDCCTGGNLKDREAWWNDYVAPNGPILATDTNKACNQVCYHGECVLVKNDNPGPNDCHRHEGPNNSCASGKVCHLGQCTTGRIDGCSSVAQLQTSDLGSIHHSNPVVVGAPEMDLPFESYRTFATKTGDRDTMLYVGGNDGMMHAFLLGAFRPKDAPATHKEGMEMWSFVPKAVYGKLTNAAYGQDSFVDGQFTVRDLRLFRKANGDEEWATALIGGLRRGGREYFALDVSDPIWDPVTSTGPKLLWEITNKDPGFERLSYTYARAEVGSVVVELGGEIQEVAVAFLPAGMPVDDTDPLAGKALYVVRVDNGELIKAIELEEGDAPLVGSPAAFNTFPGAQVSRVFVGDAQGRLWRFDVSSPDPDDWNAAENARIFYDPINDGGLAPQIKPEPVFFKPAIAKNNMGELVIVFGNGDIDNLSSWGQEGNYVASITEKITIDDGNIKIEMDQNWFHHFDDSGTWKKGEKLTGDPLIFDGVAYFASFVPGTTACDFGSGRLSAFDYQDLSKNPVVDLTGDGSKDTSLNFGQNTVVYGAEISARPACFERDGGDGSYSVTSATRCKPQLTVQTGVRAFESGTAPNTTSTVRAATQAEATRIDLPFPTASLKPLSWSLVMQ
jgi:hypothetical protein